ncbi:MAG: hypothetical protein ACRDF0_11070 [Candidatus Limnocylindria bacterium]
MRGMIAGVSAFALVVTACASAPAVACGDPERLVPHPRGIIVPGIRVGPLLVTTGMWNGLPDARLGWDRPEQLSKFLIDDIDRFEAPLTVTGRRCDDARALRFAAGPPWPFGAELPTEEIERRTTVSIAIDPPPPPHFEIVGEVLPWIGYFIFTAPGRWVVEVKEADRVRGSAVLEVVEAGGAR